MYRTSEKKRWSRSVRFQQTMSFVMSLFATLVCAAFAATTSNGAPRVLLALGALAFAVPTGLIGHTLFKNWRSGFDLIVDDVTLLLPDLDGTGPTRVQLSDIESAHVTDFRERPEELMLKIRLRNSDLVVIERLTVGAGVFSELISELQNRGLAVQDTHRLTS